MTLSLISPLLLLACGGNDDSGDSRVEGQITVAATVSTLAPEELDVTTTAGGSTTTATSGQAQASRSLADFENLVQQTIEMPVAAFELSIRVEIPGALDILTARTTGTFDDDTGFGEGSRMYWSADPAVPQTGSDKPFEFRLIGQMMWVYNAIGEPPQWAGFDIGQLEAAAGGSPLASVDGDLYLLLLKEAATEIVEVREVPNGRVSWTIRVRADDLIYILTTSGGSASRLIGIGADQTGMMVDVTLTEHEDGYISGFTGNFDEWWTNAIELAGDDDYEDQKLAITFNLSPTEAPSQPVPPCDNPVTEQDEELDILVCPQ